MSLKALRHTFAIILIAITFQAAPLLAATWYIDASIATSGDGRSWQTAWKDTTDILWNLIQPGSTIIFSGGTAGLNYSQLVNSSNQSGTEAAPIVIRPSSEAGRSGLVTVRGLNLENGAWLTIDGKRAGAIGMRITSPGWHCVYAKNMGIKLSYLEIGSCGLGERQLDSGGNLAQPDAIRLNSQSGDLRGIEISHSWIHDAWKDGIVAVRGASTGYGSWSIHHNIIEQVGDDGMEIAGGVDVYNNTVRDVRFDLGDGHRDCLQFAGRYLRIYNNRFYDFSVSCGVFGQSNEQEGGNWRIYNNIFYRDDLEPANTRGIQLYASNNVNEGNIYKVVVWDDIVIANNLVANFTNFNGLKIAKRDEVGSLTIKNFLVANNIFVENYSDNAGGYQVELPNLGSIEDLIFANNVVAGRNTRLLFRNATYATAEDLNAQPGAEANSSLLPFFMDFASRNFFLRRTDTIALNRGKNLTTYFQADARGVARPTAGAWDIGPYQFATGETNAPNPPSGLRAAPESRMGRSITSRDLE